MNTEKKLIILQDCFKSLSSVVAKLAKISEDLDPSTGGNEFDRYTALVDGLAAEKMKIEQAIDITIQERKFEQTSLAADEVERD